MFQLIKKDHYSPFLFNRKLFVRIYYTTEEIVHLLSSVCDQVSELWQQLELASELQSDLQDTVNWGKKYLLDFNAGNTQLV